MNTLKSLIIGVVTLAIGSLIFLWAMASSVKKVEFTNCDNCQNEQLLDNLKVIINTAEYSGMDIDEYLSIQYLINEYERQDIFSIADSTKNIAKADSNKNKHASDFVEKFVVESKKELGSTVWNSIKISKISRKISDISRYNIITSDSFYRQDIDEFKTAISDYYLIERFIKSCKTYNHPLGSDIKDEFPINRLKTSWETDARKFKSRKYVKNIDSFKKDLNNIVEFVFNAHYRYLENKINKYNQDYKYFPKHDLNGYDDLILTPLANQIEKIEDSGEYSLLGEELKKRTKSNLEKLIKNMYPNNYFKLIN